MRTQGNFPDSGKPFRSRRIGHPETVQLVNNRAVIKPARGTYRLQAFANPATNVSNVMVFFVVGEDDFAKHFGAAPTEANVRAEFLCAGGVQLLGAVYHAVACEPVEVDVLDDQVVWFWSFRGGEVIKYVKVGDLNPNDYEVSDRER